MTKTSIKGRLGKALACGCSLALAASLAPAAGIAWAAAPLPEVASPTDIQVNVGTLNVGGTAYTPFASKTVDVASLSYGSNAVLYKDSNDWGVVATDRYVTLDTILEEAGLEQYWGEGASLAYSSATTATALSLGEASFKDAEYSDYEDMFFYGDTQKDTNANKVESPKGTKAEPGIALYAYSATIGDGDFAEETTASEVAEAICRQLKDSNATDGALVEDNNASAPEASVTYMKGLNVTQYRSGAAAALAAVTTSGAASIASVNILVGDPTNATRIYGQEWADTMTQAVESTFGSDDQTNIVLTTAETFQDALAASGLAGALECPVVMTDGDELTEQAGDLIQKYLKGSVSSAPVAVYVIGGEVAIKPAVVDAVKTLPAFYGKQATSAGANGLWVERIAGDEAWDTSLKIYEKIAGLTGGSYNLAGKADVIVACSGGFQDAMSIAPYAYATGTPIVLTDNENKLSDGTVEKLTGLTTGSIVNIVGGPAVVSYQVDSQLAGKGSIYRTFGQSAYDTSNEIATLLYKGGEARFAKGSSFNGATVACLATGENYLDALASAAYCGTAGNGGSVGGTNKTAVLLLVSNSDSTTIDGFLTDYAEVNKGTGAALETARIFGGEGVLGKAVQMEADQALTKAVE